MKDWTAGYFCDCPGSDPGLSQGRAVPLAAAENGYLQEMKGTTSTYDSLQ